MANWSGTWPGLVGMLNLNGSLTKAGKKYSTLWSEDFTDEFFRKDLQAVARQGRGQAPDQARHAAEEGQDPVGRAASSARPWPSNSRREKAIMGIFDEGCMGMYNAIIPDELLNPTGRLQGTAQPVGPVLRDHAGQRRRGPGRPQVAGRARA